MTQEFVTLRREVVERALEAWIRGCPPDCKDGMTDSGGVNPLGEAALIRCPACQAVEALRAALDQPQNHIPDAGDMVPAGWKLVPVEPTRDMLTKWIKAPVVSNTTAPGLYRAMLAAAPQPPADQRGTAAPNARSSQVIDAITSYCNTGEIDGADDLLAEILLERDHPPAVEWSQGEPLTHQQIDAIAESMPGGLDGFLKGWGWRQLSRAIEAAHNIK